MTNIKQKPPHKIMLSALIFLELVTSEAYSLLLLKFNMIHPVAKYHLSFCENYPSLHAIIRAQLKSC